MHRRSAALALLGIVLACSWQAIAVHTTYHGNWTGLFCAGDHFTRPPEMQSGEYVFHSSSGYDGQFYQLIAHDPLLQRHYYWYIDAPRLRYRRILMPGLAGLLVGEQFEWIDASNILVCWLFIGLGTFCLAELAVEAGRSVWWGLLFLVTPATLLGIERMTVDVSLTALTLAALLAAHRQRWLLLWLTLAGAMLSKETGVIVIAATVFWLARQKRFRLAVWMGLSALPAIGWYAFVQSHTRGDYSTAGFKFITPFFAILNVPLDPGFPSLLFRIVTVIAVAGLLWAAVRSVVLAVQDHLCGIEAILSFCFAALVLLFQNASIWGDPDGFPRIYSPLLVCLIAATWREGFAQTLAQFAMVACPIGMQLGWDLARPVLGLWITR